MFLSFKVATNFITAIRETLNETSDLFIFKEKKADIRILFYLFFKLELQTLDSSNNYTSVPFMRAFLLRGHKKKVQLSGSPTYPGSQLSGFL